MVCSVRACVGGRRGCRWCPLIGAARRRKREARGKLRAGEATPRGGTEGARAGSG